ncbi:MAG: hypothetical protein QOG97_713 [Acidimicrobiaceae bacterium]|jgi:hypothetical protein|nr:hypothetical protein [Acidimicrobiaceae bacterium]MDQ1440485.1 hypothetical protein [Acidimicrobiaceae bacterium]
MSPAHNTVRTLQFDVAVPNGWDVRIKGSAPGTSGSVDYPVVHAANFALSATREDFGGELVARMTGRQVFVALLGYGSDGAGHGLFAPSGLPRALQPDWFDPLAMQRPIAGMAGVQRFFSAEGRKFCLYAVLGSYARRAVLVPAVNQFLAGVTIQPAASAAQGAP